MRFFRMFKTILISIIVIVVVLNIVMGMLAPILPLAIAGLVVGGTVAMIVSRRSRL
jgi:hypothetical protein